MGSISAQGTNLDFGPVPGQSEYRRQLIKISHIDVSIFLLLPFLLFLKPVKSIPSGEN